jgi:hypothetical protein
MKMVWIRSTDLRNGRIFRYILQTVLQILTNGVADPDPFDTDPDPACHFDTGPDPVPAFQFYPDSYRFKEVPNVPKTVRYLFFTS